MITKKERYARAKHERDLAFKAYIDAYDGGADYRKATHDLKFWNKELDAARSALSEEEGGKA
jgi:hypothetical protein